ncbi:hypothetical protein FC85_GL002519 [Lentilactobacillus diolivorans DSM 14421]|uniref:Uncharacterized protein n=1 Tax=Lentilactobacillus diolivorans DSM 14421 TaxID=1423739 RepID=A0A0R1SFT0_9LACO|nr:hypothetical protein FC85_GL002519 [Lentilactobacillus diolivorans DSM 14421]
MAGSCGSFARLGLVTKSTNIPDFGILICRAYMAGSCGSFARLGTAAQKHQYS